MYAIISWDPDAPNKSLLHWMIVNCTTADNSDGKVIASWAPPSPPPGTGEHRYIIGLFKQNGSIDVPEFADRTSFNATTFSTQHGLSPLAYKGFRVKAADGPPPPAPTPLPPTATHSIPPLLNIPPLPLNAPPLPLPLPLPLQPPPPPPV